MPTNDGRVIIKIDSNAKQAASDFQLLNQTTEKYERILAKVQGTANANLTVYKKLADKLKEQQRETANALNSYRKLSNVKFDSLNQQTSTAVNRLRDLALQGKADTTAFNQLAASIRKSQTAMSNANKTVDAAINKEKKLDETTKKLKTSNSDLITAVRALTTAYATVKILELGKNAIKVASDFEQLSISFKVLTGSKEIADDLLNSMIDLASKTPLTTKVLADNAKTMLLFGINTQDILPDLQRLGDITGGNAQKMASLTLAFSQASATGRLMGQDLLQMVNAGFNPLQIISEKTGMSMADLKKKMEDGAISIDMVNQAMVDATSEGGRFFGLMNEQSKTLAGRWSTLQDTSTLLAKAWGELLTPEAKKVVEWLIVATEKSNNFINSLILSRKAIQDLNLEQLQQRLRNTYIEEDKLNKRFEFLKNNSPHYKKAIAEISTEQEVLTNRIMELVKNQKEQNVVSKDIIETNVEINETWQKLIDKMNAVSGSHRKLTKKTKEAKGAFDELQESAQKLRIELENIAVGGINPSEMDLFTQKSGEYAKKLQEIETVQKSIPTLKPLEPMKGDFDILNEKATKLKESMQNLLAADVVDMSKFTELKTEYEATTTKIKEINDKLALNTDNKFNGIAQNISSSLAIALTTPFKEGETAAQRFGKIAERILVGVLQQMIQMTILKSVFGVATGGVGFALPFANGGVLQNGKTQAFADGGVVNSPTYFPMAGGNTGLMGEAGAEAIMPLKRGSDGKLGVQATSPTVNIYNQSGANIETVKRPNGEMDIFIKKVNMALANERTNGSFGSASQRLQSSGVQAV